MSTDLPAKGAGTEAIMRLKHLTRLIDTRPFKGRVTKAVGTIIHAVIPNVSIGEICILEDPSKGWTLNAEVVGFAGEAALLTPIGDLRGLSTRTEVQPTGNIAQIQVGWGLLGRVVDSQGEPLDNLGPLISMTGSSSLHASAPDPLSRQLISKVLPLGLRVLDGLLTCGEGQRFGIYGEPGDGKSSLLAQIVKGAEIDVAVIALIGERGREVREFIEHQLGTKGMARSVLVVATSDRPAMERARAAYVATPIAEFFRDEGRRVLLIMDSVTRFARALREIGLSAGEPPTRRGFPPSVFAVLPQLMERAGPAAHGSITAFYSVLLEGDGTGDPIAEETRGILDGHIILSRKLAATNHYPAIDISLSRSRVMEAIAKPDHKKAAGLMRELMAKFAEVEFLIKVGEYKPGADAKTDEAISKIDRIRTFLRQGTNELSSLPETVKWMQQISI